MSMNVFIAISKTNVNVLYICTVGNSSHSSVPMVSVVSDVLLIYRTN